MRAANRDRRAFTLVEVLVSLAIFALAALVLSSAYLNVLSGYQRQDRDRQIFEGWDLVRVIVLTEPERDKLTGGGRIILPDGSTLNWSVVIEPTTLADLFSLELTAEVSGDSSWIKTGRLMVLRPGWSDPGDRDKLREDSRQRLAKERSR